MLLFSFFFYWRIVDLKCVNFCYTAKWFNYRGLVTKSCSTLGNPINSSLPGSSAHGILQTRILEWVVIRVSWGSSRPRGWTQVSHIAGRFFTIWATRASFIYRVFCFHCFFLVKPPIRRHWFPRWLSGDARDTFQFHVRFIDKEVPAPKINPSGGM